MINNTLSKTGAPGLLNLKTPQSNGFNPQNASAQGMAGLMSTNPFLSGTQNPLTNNTNTTTAGTTTAALPQSVAPKQTSGGIIPAANTPVTLAAPGTPAQDQAVAYTLNGKNFNKNGDLVTAPSSPAPTGGTAGLIPPPQNQGSQTQVTSIQNPPAPVISPTGNTPNAGSGTGGGAAPAGMMYNGQGQLVPQTSFGGTVGALGTMAGNSSPQYQAAQSQYNQANSDLAALKADAANQEKNIGGSRTNLSEAGGEEGLLQNLVSGKEAALTGEMSAAQQAAQVATGQQSTQQQGLGTAGSLLQPQVGSYGQTQYNPLGGTVSGSTQVSPSDPFYQTLQTYAQSLASGQGSAIPSSITGNPALQAQLLQMAKQINPSFNYNTAQGLGAAQQSNAATAGTAQTGASNSVYQKAVGDLAQYQNMAQNIKSFGDQALQNIQTLPLTSSQLANTTIGQAMTQFNSPQYAQFSTNIQGLQARVSALLGTGEIPSSATAGAQAIINGNLNLGALQATMNQINNEADSIVQNQASIASNAYSNIQGNGSNTNTTASGANPWH